MVYSAVDYHKAVVVVVGSFLASLADRLVGSMDFQSWDYLDRIDSCFPLDSLERLKLFIIFQRTIKATHWVHHVRIHLYRN